MPQIAMHQGNTFIAEMTGCAVIHADLDNSLVSPMLVSRTFPCISYGTSIRTSVNAENDRMGLCFIKISWPGNHRRQLITVGCGNRDHLCLAIHIVTKIVRLAVRKLLDKLTSVIQQSDLGRCAYIGIRRNEMFAVWGYCHLVGIITKGQPFQVLAIIIHAV